MSLEPKLPDPLALVQLKIETALIKNLQSSRLLEAVIVSEIFYTIKKIKSQILKHRKEVASIKAGRLSIYATGSVSDWCNICFVFYYYYYY